MITMDYVKSKQHFFGRYFFIFGNTPGSHACSSIYAQSDTVSPVYIFLNKVFVKKSKVRWHVLFRATQKFFLEILFSHITRETRKNGTITHVSWLVELNCKIPRLLLLNLLLDIWHISNTSLNSLVRKWYKLTFWAAWGLQASLAMK